MLAEYIDGGLEPRERAKVEEHLAECGECYENFAEAVRIPRTVAAPARVARPKAARIVAAVAAVLVVGVLSYRQWWSFDARLRASTAQLIEATGQTRVTEGRLSEGFPWAPVASATRGAAVASPSIETTKASIALHDLARSSSDPAALRASAVAHLVNGELDEAITQLEAAIAGAPHDAASQLNLSAALFERYRRDGRVPDAARALDASRRVLLDEPMNERALFNEALSLEVIGLKADAITAWEAYLTVDATSAWAAEARERVAKLRGAAEAVSIPALDDSRVTQRAIANAAKAQPHVLYRALEDATAQWADDASAKDLPPAASIAAAALNAAGRDRQLFDVVTAIGNSSHWPASRVQCLKAGVAALASARSAFAATEYSKSTEQSRSASRNFACAGVTVLEAELYELQTGYFADRDAVYVDRLAALEVQASHLGYSRIVGRIRHIRGLAAYRAGRLGDALAHYAAGKDAYRSAGDPQGLAGLAMLTAETRNEQGDDLNAWPEYVSALAALPQMSSYRSIHSTLSSVALACQKLGWFGAESYFADQLLDYATKHDNAAGIVAAHIERADALGHLKGWSAARDDLALAKTWHPKMPDGALKQQYVGDVGWIEGRVLEEVDPAGAVRALTSALTEFERTSFRSRLAEVLLARGRAYRRMKNDAAAVADWEQAARIFEDDQPGVRDEQLRISRASDLWTVFEELISASRTNAPAALALMERAHGRALLDSVAGRAIDHPLSGTDAYAWLPDGVTVLSYAVLRDSVAVAVVTARGLRVDYHPAPLGSVDALVRQRVEFISQNRVDRSQALDELLIPVDACASGSTVVIIPDGSLNRLPFAALRDKSGGFLGDRCAVLIAPSISVLKRLSMDAARRPDGVILLRGLTTRHANLPALPGAVAELESIRSIYRAPIWIDGGQMTRAALIERLGAGGVLHFSGHAITDDFYPSRSRLLLSDDDATGLGPADIAAMSLARGTTVVLGACETAVGRVFRGEGASSLARSFLAAGATSVVGSLWKVQDASAMTLLTGFHRALAAGVPAVQALAQAQRSMARQGFPVRDWAAFQVIGGLQRSHS